MKSSNSLTVSRLPNQLVTDNPIILIFIESSCKFLTSILLTTLLPGRPSLRLLLLLLLLLQMSRFK